MERSLSIPLQPALKLCPGYSGLCRKTGSFHLSCLQPHSWRNSKKLWGHILPLSLPGFRVLRFSCLEELWLFNWQFVSWTFSTPFSQKCSSKAELTSCIFKVLSGDLIGQQLLHTSF